MTIESEVTGGRATWLEVLRYDLAAALVELRTAVLDQSDVPARRVIFTEVSKYAEEPFDPALPRDANLLEHLVGIDVHDSGSETWYVIATDEREVSFYSDASPRIGLLRAAPYGESEPPAA